jgi:MSHA biogenesis protein MshI
LRLINKFARKKASKPAGMVGIEIGQEGIALSRLVYDGDAPVLTLCHYARCKTHDDIERVLSEWVVQHDLQGSACCWVLHPNDYRIMMIEAPNVPRSEYAAAARWLIKDMIDYPLESAVVDAFSPSHAVASHQKKMYVVVSQKEYLEPYQKIIEGVGLVLKKISVQEMVLRNLMSLCGKEDQPAALLQVSLTRSLLMVVMDDDVTLMRTLNLGARQLSGMDDLSRLDEELKRSLSYYHEQLKQEVPQRVWVAPLLQADAVLMHKMQTELPENVALFDLSSVLTMPKGVSMDEQARCFASIGAAVG